MSRLHATETKFLKAILTRRDCLRNEEIRKTMGVESLKYLLEKFAATHEKNGQEEAAKKSFRDESGRNYSCGHTK